MDRFDFSLRFTAVALLGTLVALGTCALLSCRSIHLTLTKHLGTELLAVTHAAAQILDARPAPESQSGQEDARAEEGSWTRQALQSVVHATRFHGVTPSLIRYRPVPDSGGRRELEQVAHAGRDQGRRFAPGKRSAAASHHLRALKGSVECTGLYSDADGTWISAVAPIRDLHGQIVGLVQADLPGSMISWQVQENLTLFAMAGGLSAVVMLAGALWWGRRMDLQLAGLSRAMHRAAQGDLERHFTVDRSGSIGRMITDYNRLIGLLESKKQETEIKIGALEDAGREARQTGQSQIMLLANVSHEMRHTINGVMGLNQIILETPLSPEQRDLAQSMRQSAESLLVLLTDILDYASIQQVGLSLVQTNFDPLAVLENTLETFAPQAHRKGLELIGWMDDSMPHTLIGDSGRFRQVLSNLIANAIKFTDHGEIMVAVLAADITPDDVLINVNVRDTGVGIAETSMHLLFQADAKYPTTATRNTGGTGLGLAICKQIVESMHGSIGVESRPSQGATFWFTLRAGYLAPIHPPPAVHPDLAHGLRVLVVDDNLSFRHVLSQHLTAMGVRHEVVADGVDALRYLHRDIAAGVPYTAVLIDANLEGMNAMTLARTLREDSALARVKIVLLTSQRDRSHAIAEQRREIWMCLRKPIRRQLLLHCLLQLAQSLQPPGAAPVTPPALAPAAPTEPPPAPCPNATVNGKHVHVLVAEDDRVTQRLVRHMLRRFGYNPHIVGTGRQAVAAIGSEHFDFILMDCFMPELDGFESCKTIRRLTSGTSVPSRHPTAALAEGGTRQRPYIIALTAQALPGDRERCYAAGMDDYVTKPIEPADLKDALMRGEAALDARDREAA